MCTCTATFIAFGTPCSGNCTMHAPQAVGFGDERNAGGAELACGPVRSCPLPQVHPG